MCDGSRRSARGCASSSPPIEPSASPAAIRIAPRSPSTTKNPRTSITIPARTLSSTSGKLPQGAGAALVLVAGAASPAAAAPASGSALA